jgi:hypothetical protein
MLTHTLWRKTFPDELNIADRAMNQAIYSLLENKRWRSASEFGEFSLTPMMSKQTTSILKMIRIVNTALALKNRQHDDKAIALIDEIDWTGSIRDFKLAVEIIKNNFEEAAKIMKDIGQNGELVDEVAYYQWPLFEEFRGRIEFQNTFKEIYGKEFRSQLNIPKANKVKTVKKKPKKH